MASTYQELKDRVQLLIYRDDASTQVAVSGNTVDMLDNFIAKAEKRFYRSEAARIPPLERFVTFTLTSGTGVAELAIPSDYFETRFITAISPQSTQVTLERTSPDRILNTNLSEQGASYPTEFAYGNNVWLVPQSSQQIDITANYYGYLDAVSTVTSPDSENWLLNHGDDLLEYWAAVEAGLYFGSINPQDIELWESRGQAIHDQIVEQEIRQQASGTTPTQGRPYRF